MIPITELIFFALAAMLMAISPGPNMIYLISRSITQGRRAGLISLAGVLSGFGVHIILVSVGLTAILFAVPYVYSSLKILGAAYLLYLAVQTINSKTPNVFQARTDIQKDGPFRLFTMGFLTNVLNPKVAIFYMSLFPQFIAPANGSVIRQSIQLGFVQVMVSFVINCIVILSAAKLAQFFVRNPTWIWFQKWLMAGILSALAVKIILDDSK